MNAIPRLRDYRGPALLSYGFRPFFLFGAIYAGLAVLAWLPIFNGELNLWSAFSAVDWHVHEMLYGYLPAVVTGFLLTAIPNWTGRLPIQGTPLLVLVLVWLAGRVCVTFSAETGWLLAAIVDVSFLALVVAAAAREIVAGKNWRNLRVVGLVTMLLAGNIAFHVEAHVQGTAEYGARVGIAVIVMLIVVIGGRIVPSFTRNWLARENPGRLPAPFARFDVVTMAASCRGAGAVGRAARWSAGWRSASPDSRGTQYRASGPLGRGPDRPRSSGAHSACWLRFRAARLSARECGGTRPDCAQCGGPRLDSRGGRHHDARGDDPRQPRSYRQCPDRFADDAGDLCDRCYCVARADLRFIGTRME